MFLDLGVEVIGFYCSVVDIINIVIFIFIFKIINQKYCFIIGYFCRSGVYVFILEGFSENVILCFLGIFNYLDVGFCFVGFYCFVGIVEFEKCFLGIFSNEIKLFLVEQCQNCIVGRYCGEFNLVKFLGFCREGYYCFLGVLRFDWIECFVGVYCVNGIFEFELCFNGIFRNIIKGMFIEDCFSCIFGYYC